MKHPTIKQLKQFYHDRWAMKKWHWIFFHIMKCRRCSKKFATLKVRYKFKHKGTDPYSYRYITQLWDTHPEVAEHRAICYGVCVFVSWGLSDISSLEDMWLYLDGIKVLDDLGVKDSEKYLNYKNIDDAWLVFENSAHLLANMEPEECFFIFRNLAWLFILTWDKEATESKFPIYMPDSNISYISKHLGIPTDIAYKISEEELWNLQIFWKKRALEKENV